MIPRVTLVLRSPADYDVTREAPQADRDEPELPLAERTAQAEAVVAAFEEVDAALAPLIPAKAGIHEMQAADIDAGFDPGTDQATVEAAVGEFPTQQDPKKAGYEIASMKAVLETLEGLKPTPPAS